jgi:hypothetical protein
VRSRYHAVLAVKACARACGPCSRARSGAALTAALRREVPSHVGNPAYANQKDTIMDKVSAEVSAITATRVAEDHRLDFLPRHFKGWMLIFEGAVYARLRHLCAHYHGGYWEFFDLSNGGCYMAPACGEFHLQAPNGYEGTVDADTTGVIVTLYALSHLSFQHPTKDVFAKHFHELRDFAMDHPQASAIFAAID